MARDVGEMGSEIRCDSASVSHSCAVSSYWGALRAEDAHQRACRFLHLGCRRDGGWR